MLGAIWAIWTSRGLVGVMGFSVRGKVKGKGEKVPILRFVGAGLCVGVASLKENRYRMQSDLIQTRPTPLEISESYVVGTAHPTILNIHRTKSSYLET